MTKALTKTELRRLADRAETARCRSEGSMSVAPATVLALLARLQAAEEQRKALAAWTDTEADILALSRRTAA